MTYFVTNFHWVGEEGEVFLRQNGRRGRFYCHGRKVDCQYKSENYLFRRGDGKNNMLRNEEEVLNSLCKIVFKPQLLQQLPVNPSLCSPPKLFAFPHFLHHSLLLSSLISFRPSAILLVAITSPPEWNCARFWHVVRKCCARVNGSKSCRRPVISLSHATKSYRVNEPLGRGKCPHTTTLKACVLALACRPNFLETTGYSVTY